MWKSKFIVFSMLSLLLSCFPLLASASEATTATLPDLSGSTLGFMSIVIFIVAYIGVMTEEYTDLAKSKPVILAAGLIWIIVAIVAKQHGVDSKLLEEAINHNLIEYASMMLFLLVAMTYINVMIERNVFEALRSWLVHKGFSFKQIFWITGFLAFFISPVADNLTTALLMGTVILSVGGTNAKFVTLSFINIVVGANAGGAFSPFGDITTLMVWQADKSAFFDFFSLFLPALTNFLVPAVIMSFAIPNEHPDAVEESVSLKVGARRVCLLFLVTIAIAVGGEQMFHLPPFIGMLTGLSILFLFGYFLKNHERKLGHQEQFNVISKVAQAEWDTLLFFYGVIFCVGGLAFLGYLSIASQVIYDGMGATTANILVGIFSAIVDNIPVMFAVLTMDPAMSEFQWLLVTLTAGVGGSLLAIGSAAGVALLGQSKLYTFGSHLKWTWAIALGYAASIWVHFLVG